jgi:hypothetical protein
MTRTTVQVLNFFAAPDTIQALSVEELQHVLEGVVFEPWLWQRAPVKELPEKVRPAARDYSPSPARLGPADARGLQVPCTESRDHLASPVGLLFNELQKSPQGVLAALSKMMELALELDTVGRRATNGSLSAARRAQGRWTVSTAPIILFVIRLLVRIEGFLVYLINYHHWDKQSINGSTWLGFCRGLDCTDAQVAAMTLERAKLRQQLNDQVFPLLECWLDFAMKHNDVDHACVLHAHLAFIHLHTMPHEYTPEMITTFLTSQVRPSPSSRPVAADRSRPDLLDCALRLRPRRQGGHQDQAHGRRQDGGAAAAAAAASREFAQRGSTRPRLRLHWAFRTRQCSTCSRSTARPSWSGSTRARSTPTRSWVRRAASPRTVAVALTAAVVAPQRPSCAWLPSRARATSRWTRTLRCACGTAWTACTASAASCPR